ncbi:paraquat-inducible protein A [Frateuria aurantia]
MFQRCALGRGESARCSCCGAKLEQMPRISVRGLLALILTAVALFLIANTTAIFSLQMGGSRHSATAFEVIYSMWTDHFYIVALVVLLTLVLAPLIKILLLSWLLLFAARGKRAPGFKPLMVTLHYVRPWTMIEVFVLGVLVSIVKAQLYFKVSTSAGLFAYAGIMILITMYSSFDIRMLWDLPLEERSS